MLMPSWAHRRPAAVSVPADKAGLGVQAGGQQAALVWPGGLRLCGEALSGAPAMGQGEWERLL